jgi:hypothetical protein
MGKGLLLLVTGAIMAGTMMMSQSRQTAMETTIKQAKYQEEVLAREIARSAYGIAYQYAQAAGNDVDLAIANVNGRTESGIANADGILTGDYNGGDFDVQAYSVDGQSVRIRSTGRFGRAEFTINDNYNVRLLTVNEFSRIQVGFLESMAGYCSAVFLQRFIPNNGVEPSELGGFENQTIRDNAIANMTLSDDEKYWILPPEMIFDSGRNRTGADTEASPDGLILAPRTRINFFIGVDRDCSQEGQWNDIYSESRYDWVHSALEEDTDNLVDLQEGKFAMIEQNATDDQTWRIAFEDLDYFEDAKLDDIKANGYGSNWDVATQTYGGSGWTDQNAAGYRQLNDYGSKPDFSDQVIEVTLSPCSGSCGPAT